MGKIFVVPLIQRLPLKHSRQVVLAMDYYYFNYRSNVHRSPYKLGIKATEAYGARHGGESYRCKREIIFTSGATMETPIYLK